MLPRPYVLSLAKQEDDLAVEPAKKKRKLDPNCVAGPSRTPSAESRRDVHISSSDAPDGDVPKRMPSFFILESRLNAMQPIQLSNVPSAHNP